MKALLLTLLGLLVAAACAETSGDNGDPPAAMGGSGAAGASNGARGGDAGATSAGTTGSGGENTSAGTTGSGGENTSAGATGSGGEDSGFVSSGEPECQTDLDCRIVESCCDCFPAPSSAEVAECDLTCEQSHCGARGLSDVTAACRGQRCVFDVSCNQAQVACDAAEPACSAGLIPSVADSCWGPCVQPSECSDIGTCSACPASSSQVCVTDDSSFLLAVQCVEVTSSCAENPTCDCVAACFAQCADTNGIGCFCVSC